VGKAEFSWSGMGTPSKQCGSCCAVVWASKGSLLDQLPFSADESGNRMQAGDFQGFLPVQRRKQRRQLMGQNCFSASRRTHQQQMVTAGSSDGESLTREILSGKVQQLLG
tara:strand:- start:173 stop:502 length:330 start_codon:yes stop_codon:yes gene_type:complete